MVMVGTAALHRIVWAGEDSEEMLRTGGWVTVAALVPLALGLAGDAHVVFTRIFGAPGPGVAAAAAVWLGLWFAWPIAARRRRSQGVPSATDGASGR